VQHGRLGAANFKLVGCQSDVWQSGICGVKLARFVEMLAGGAIIAAGRVSVAKPKCCRSRELRVLAQRFFRPAMAARRCCPSARMIGSSSASPSCRVRQSSFSYSQTRFHLLPAHQLQQMGKAGADHALSGLMIAEMAR